MSSTCGLVVLLPEPPNRTFCSQITTLKHNYIYNILYCHHTDLVFGERFMQIEKKNKNKPSVPEL